MNKPLPSVTCPTCHLVQQYHGQHNCIHCEKPLPNWSVATQLLKKSA